MRPGVFYTAFLAVTGLAWAAEGDEKAALRARLLAKIDDTQQQIEQRLLERNSLEEELRRIESDRVKAADELAQAEQQLHSSGERLTQLEQDHHRQQRRAEQLENRLARIIRINYSRLTYPPLRIILETNNERNWTRHLAYLKHLTAAQWRLSVEAHELSRDLSATIAELRKLRTAVAARREKQQRQLQTLERLGKERSSTLQRIKSELVGERDRLVNYQRTKERLQQLANSIGELRLDELAPERPFASLRGRLPSPVADARGEADKRRSGIRLFAPYGEEVRAPAAGRVVFANWISGLGLVLILDHGEDYLSLYAHNQRFAASVGDWVKPGQLIGFVGDSGGNNLPMLLLQLLHQGRQLNPTEWLGRG